MKMTMNAAAVVALFLSAVGCSAASSDPVIAGEGSADDAELETPAPAPARPNKAADIPTAPAAVPELGPAADACVVAAAAKQADVDPEDSPETPWKRTPGQKLVVQFENSGAAQRYWSMIKQAAQIWSQSPCVRAEAVTKCAAGAHCVRVKQARVSDDDDDTDGEFSGDETGGVRTGGTITVFTELMDESSDNGALATIVHEMGHAFGLVHRLDTSDVMNADTDDDTNPKPDPVDFANLLAIYGTRR